MGNRWNRFIYACWAPVYDRLIGLPAFRAARERAIGALDLKPGENVLLSGIGTGADLPFLPGGVAIAGIDLSEAMLVRARRRAEELSLDADLRQGDAQALPFEAGEFDAVVLTLILSVVPDAGRCLREAWRVLRPGGRAIVFDKFLPPAKTRAPFGRRLLNVLTRPFGTDINRRFEEISRGLDFAIVRDEPAMFGGAYRIILLREPGDSNRS